MKKKIEDFSNDDLKWGGKDMTYIRLIERVAEIQNKKIVEKCPKHNLIFIRNVYESEIPKSEWKCSECGKIKFKPYFNKTEK